MMQHQGGVAWRKSSASGSSNCVEVGLRDGTVLLRDTKDRSGPVLAFTQDEWLAFLAGVGQDEFSMENLTRQKTAGDR